MSRPTDERADFEAWARDRYPSIDLTRHGDDYAKALAKDYWSLWQAARRTQVVPKGWKLVPALPTLKMQQAALKHVARQHQTRDVYEAMLSAAPQPQEPAGPMPSERYKHCNHHHDLTPEHVLVDFGDGAFVANIQALPLLQALNDLGLRTRTHHVDGNGGFVSVLLDGDMQVRTEVKEVNERDATRTKYNGRTELLISWRNKNAPTKIISQ